MTFNLCLKWEESLKTNITLGSALGFTLEKIQGIIIKEQSHLIWSKIKYLWLYVSFIRPHGL